MLKQIPFCDYCNRQMSDKDEIHQLQIKIDDHHYDLPHLHDKCRSEVIKSIRELLTSFGTVNTNTEIPKQAVKRGRKPKIKEEPAEVKKDEGSTKDKNNKSEKKDKSESNITESHFNSSINSINQLLDEYEIESAERGINSLKSMNLSKEQSNLISSLESKLAVKKKAAKEFYDESKEETESVVIPTKRSSDKSTDSKHENDDDNPFKEVSNELEKEEEEEELPDFDSFDDDDDVM